MAYNFNLNKYKVWFSVKNFDITNEAPFHMNIFNPFFDVFKIDVGRFQMKCVRFY